MQAQAGLLPQRCVWKKSGSLEITRGTAFGASRISIGCSFSLEPALVIDVWLESLRRVSLLFRTMLSGPVPALTIGGSAGNTCPPNMGAVGKCDREHRQRDYVQYCGLEKQRSTWAVSDRGGFASIRGL